LGVTRFDGHPRSGGASPRKDIPHHGQLPGQPIDDQTPTDGRRAERAALDALPGTVSRAETGYVTLDWHSPADVEFVYRGVYPWTEARCAVASAVASNDSTAITMAQPAFARAHDLYNFAWEGQTSRGPGLPTRVENDPAFLTDPGTFVLDRSRPGHHVLRYLPRPGEKPEHTQVIAPILEVLLRVTGVTGAVFRGLVFADATWLRPSDEGFLHYRGGGYYLGGPVETVTIVGGQAWVTVPTESSVIPACVGVDDSTDVRVEGCRFTRLGATGLGLTKGADLIVRGCDFDTLAASGVTVTGSKDVLIEDNRVRQVGLDYSGSPGIAISDTRDCTVTRNHVADVPQCGIVGGPSRGTRILHNLVTDTMKNLADGGGIYLSGPQGDGPGNGALIRGNVIKRHPHPLQLRPLHRLRRRLGDRREQRCHACRQPRRPARHAATGERPLPRQLLGRRPTKKRRRTGRRHLRGQHHNRRTTQPERRHPHHPRAGRPAALPLNAAAGTWRNPFAASRTKTTAAESGCARHGVVIRFGVDTAAGARSHSRCRVHTASRLFSRWRRT
jgi:hypothetical protein